MAEGFGLGDGNNDFSGLRPLAESKVSEAQGRHRGHVDTGRWPGAGAVLRVLLLAFGAIVLVGWLVTVVRG